ncbi:MAG: hypothetical protein FJ288_19055, partial [Planctomycetes bacterium]|nr:hypothetical protein [Planctomycetota bacterium]
MFDRFDAADCDRRFGIMAGLGLNCVRQAIGVNHVFPYPAWECVSGGRGDPLDGGEPLKYWLSCCIGNARMDHYGKPVVVQEFGWYGGGTSRFLCDLPYRSEEEHADYTRTLTDALIPHVNGFAN